MKYVLKGQFGGAYGTGCLGIYDSADEAIEAQNEYPEYAHRLWIDKYDTCQNLYNIVQGIENGYTVVLASFDSYNDAKSWYLSQVHHTYNYGKNPAERRSPYARERIHNADQGPFHTGTPCYGKKYVSIGLSMQKHSCHNPEPLRELWQLGARQKIEANIETASEETKIYYWMSRVMYALEHSDDLLKPGYTGHCYVASEALWHLTGKTLTPACMKVNGVTHWWLQQVERYTEGPYKGKVHTRSVYDPTAYQFSGTWLNYNEGRGRGFLTKKPSKRARILIKRARLNGMV